MSKYWGKQVFTHGRFPEVGQKQKTERKKKKKNTPGTAGGPGGRDRTLAVKRRINSRKSAYFRKKIKITIFFFFLFCMYLRVMPKYWGKQIFTREFPRSGSKARDVGTIQK